MDLVKNLLDELEGKILEITGQYASAQADNELLLNKISVLNEEIAGQKIKLEQLEKQVRLLKVSKSVETTGGSQEAKEKIDTLVREIDRCIALLSK